MLITHLNLSGVILGVIIYFTDIQPVKGLRFDYFQAITKTISIMRKRFGQQLSLGRLPIAETKISIAKRSGALPGLCAALKEIFLTPEMERKGF